MANVRRISKLDFENQMSWIMDTAETPKDRKNLQKDIAALKKKYAAGRVEQGMKKTVTSKPIAMTKKSVKKKLAK